MAGRTEAYDREYWEERGGSAVPAAQPGRRQQRRDNVVQLPRPKAQRHARADSRPMHTIGVVLCFLFFAVMATMLVYSQEQLAMVTSEISQAEAQLEEAQSLEVQLNMKASLMMNSSEVEEYARSKLGMSKASPGQITYVNVLRSDRGEVLQDLDEGSLLDTALNKLRMLLTD